MKKKTNRVFIFHPYPSLGGADRSIIRLINSLKNCEIFFISITKCNYNKLVNKKINYILLKNKRVIFSLKELKKIILTNLKNRKFKKNLIISNQNFANISTILSCKNIKNLKIVLIERNHLDELKYYKNFKDFLKKIIIKWFIKKTYYKSDAIIGISKKLSIDLEKFCKKKVFTIYNPALDNKTFKSITFKNNFLNKLKKKKIFTILNVSFFEPQKDHFTLLRAFKIFNDTNKKSHLILIGKGSLENKIKEFIKTNGLVKFVTIYNNCNNPQIFFKNSDLFILSSVYEGFGNVVVESLYNKCPIITSNCNAGPSEIIDNGKYGDLYPVGNVNELVNKINSHYLHPKKLKMKCCKSKNYIKRFNTNNFSKRINKLIKEI